MSKNTAAKELKTAIETLEAKFELEKSEMNEQIVETEKEITPGKIIKSKIKQWLVPGDVVSNITGAVSGYASGSLVYKMVVGSSKNKMRKVLGAVLQITAAQVVSSLVSKKMKSKKNKP